MLSRRLLTAARVVQMRRPLHPMRGVALPALMAQIRTYADKVVNVPQMAESITEGTLKQWNKQFGDYVEQDEEIATIETDKVMVARLTRRVRVLDAMLTMRRFIDRCGRQRSPGWNPQRVLRQ